MTQSEQAFFLLPSSPPSSFIVTLSFFPLVVFFLPLSQLNLKPSLTPNPLFTHNLPRSASAGGPYSWLRKDPLVLAIGFLGWTIPAASPSPSFGGGSLFGGLLAETSAGLAQFPTPPAMDSPFWIYLITCESVLVFWGFVRVEKKREEEKVFFVSLFRSFLKKKKKKKPEN